VFGGPEALSQNFTKALSRRRNGRCSLRLISIQHGQQGLCRMRGTSDRDEMALVEEMEDFALEDMGKIVGGV